MIDSLIEQMRNRKVSDKVLKLRKGTSTRKMYHIVLYGSSLEKNVFSIMWEQQKCKNMYVHSLNIVSSVRFSDIS